MHNPRVTPQSPPMAPQDKRKLEADLLLSVRNSRGEPGVVALCRLLEARLRRQDSVLRQCQLSDFPVEQARAMVYDLLLREINT